MAGLLDFEDPNTAGAMQLGLGLLNAGGPSRMPVSLGQGIAQGGTMAMDTMRQARQDLLKKKLMQIEAEKGQLSLDQVKAELATDKAFQEEFKNVGKPPDMNRLMQIDPMRAMKLKDALAPKPITVGDNQRVLMPDAAAPTGFKTVLDALPKEKKAPEGMVYDENGVLREIPGYVAMKSKIAAAGRSPQQAERPYFTPVADATKGMGTFDNRTGKYTFDSSAPMVKPGDSPELQGRIAESKKLGTDTGEQKAQLAIKEGAVESIGEAKQMLGKGIYTGAWGPTMKSVAKFTPGYDKTKAANTEAFISHIGNVVVPRLKEFGGNDSNEELKYLKGITGGDISLEPEALKAILDSAEKKMSRNLKRLKGSSSDSGWKDL